jgi:hypothetical protein
LCLPPLLCLLSPFLCGSVRLSRSYTILLDRHCTLEIKYTIERSQSQKHTVRDLSKAWNGNATQITFY